MKRHNGAGWHSWLSKQIRLQPPLERVQWQAAVTQCWWQTGLPSDGQVWSRNEDDSHTMRSAVLKTPCCMQTSFHGSMFDRTGVIVDRSSCGNSLTFLAPVTLTLTQWPSYTHLTRSAWRHAACELRKSRLSNSYCLTDIQTRPKLYTMLLHGWSTRARAHGQHVIPPSPNCGKMPHVGLFVFVVCTIYLEKVPVPA